MAIILGIETSCDETAIAVYSKDKGLIAHEIYSQIELHRLYGGVVPELASRDHIAKIIPLVKKTISTANIDLEDLSAIAYTAGPGLAGALMVGAGFACSLAMVLNIPLIPVHHLEAHINVVLLEDSQISFPFLALLVSGGHSQILLAKSFGEYELLGDTLDDAIGEAFDKSAKIMGLPYPGGREIAKLAETGDPTTITFPRPLIGRPGCDFSFSGLKTAVANKWQTSDKSITTKSNIAASFQAAAVESCVDRVNNALKSTRCNRLVVAGGVAANTELRARLEKLASDNSCDISYPRLEFCTDNGAMVAFTGFMKYESGERPVDYNMNVFPRWNLAS